MRLFCACDVVSTFTDVNSIPCSSFVPPALADGEVDEIGFNLTPELLVGETAGAVNVSFLVGGAVRFLLLPSPPAGMDGCFIKKQMRTPIPPAPNTIATMTSAPAHTSKPISFELDDSSLGGRVGVPSGLRFGTTTIADRGTTALVSMPFVTRVDDSFATAATNCDAASEELISPASSGGEMTNAARTLPARTYWIARRERPTGQPRRMSSRRRSEKLYSERV